jgi:prevent-host-death family protein
MDEIKVTKKQATEVRNNFQDTIDHVHYTKEHVVITRHSKPWVMIVPLPEQESETQKLLDKLAA